MKKTANPKTKPNFVKRKQPTFLRGKVTTEHYDDLVNRTFEKKK